MRKFSSWKSIALCLFFGGAGVLALDSCRSNRAFDAAQRAQIEAAKQAQIAKIGAQNIAEFRRRAPDGHLLGEITLSKSNPNSVLVDLNPRWAGLGRRERDFEMRVWFAIWKNIAAKRRAGDGLIEATFFKPDGGVEAAYAD